MRAALARLAQIGAREAADRIHRHRPICGESLERVPSDGSQAGMRARFLHRTQHGVIQPEARGMLQSIAILGFALAEALAIIGIGLAFAL